MTGKPLLHRDGSPERLCVCGHTKADHRDDVRPLVCIHCLCKMFTPAEPGERKAA